MWSDRAVSDKAHSHEAISVDSYYNPVLHSSDLLMKHSLETKCKNHEILIIMNCQISPKYLLTSQ